KMLASRGQGFLFASRRDGQVAIPVAYGQLPNLPLPPESSLRRHDQARARGLRLLDGLRSEEHTSELQSRRELVCRLLVEKKKKSLRSDAAEGGDKGLINRDRGGERAGGDAVRAD